MEKKNLVIIGVIILIIIVGIICFYPSDEEPKSKQYSEITYDDCIADGSTDSECQKYIFTRNAKMEEGIREIVDEVVQEQTQEGITISIEEIEVLNLAGRNQGYIKLNCEDISFETEEEIIGNIADSLIEKYPNEYAEGSERDSWVDVDCVYDMGWRIGEGDYDMMI